MVTENENVFEIDRMPRISELILSFRQTRAKIYLNGKLAADLHGSNASKHVKLFKEARETLKPGRHLIAVHIQKLKNGNKNNQRVQFDLGLDEIFRRP